METKRYLIRELSEEEKPREKLIINGPECLDLSELLAVVLGMGTRKEDILSLTKRIFDDYGSKTILSYNSVDDIMQNLQVPKVKACQILACLEIGKRLYKPNETYVTIRSPEDVWKYVSDMYNLKKEHLRGIYLNTKNVIIHDEVISVGTVDKSIAHPRDIYAPALIHSASAVILIHNHPSGDVTPSQSDLDLTDKVRSLGEIMSVPLLDHIIISKKSYRSII